MPSLLLSGISTPSATLIAFTVLLVSACNPPSNHCERLTSEAAARSPDSEDVAWTQAIWHSLGSVFSTLTRSDAIGLEVIGPGGTWADGRPMGAGAWTCPATGQVFITSELIRHARSQPANGDDFVAFVLAHELAHLRFDAHRDAALGGDLCPNVDDTREQLADRRAAFLMAQARRTDSNTKRFSPFAVEKNHLLSGFFERELGWSARCPTLLDRVQSVQTALSDFRAYQALYSMTLDLHLAGSIGSSTDLLTTLIRHVEHVGTEEIAAVPELYVILALTHLDRAMQSISWRGEARALIPPPDALTCTPTLPAQSALSTHEAGRARATLPDYETFELEAELSAARTALSRASRLGVAPDILLGVDVCVTAMEGQHDQALTMARSVTRSASHPTLIDISRRNEAAIELMAALSGSWPEPIASPAWRARLGTLSDSVAAPDLKTLARTWAGLDELDVAPATPSRRHPAPEHEHARRALVAAFDALLPDLEAAPIASPLGLTNLTRDHLTATRIELTRGTRQLRYAVLATDAPGLLSNLDGWSQSCQVAPAGVADDGQRAMLATCNETTRSPTTWSRWLLYLGPGDDIVRIARALGDVDTPVTAPRAAASPSLLEPRPPHTGRRHALVVGIDRYTGAKATDCPPREHRDLRGAAHDARAITALLRDRGFEDIRTLIDGNPDDPPPTRANILAALDELANPAWIGHDVVFYFAGHGSQTATRMEDGERWETLVPQDSASSCAPDIVDKELAAAYGKILWAIDPDDTGRGALTVIVDSCHSGSASKSSGTPRVVGPARIDSTHLPSDVPPRNRGPVVLSASSKDELAYEFAAPDGRHRGAFTTALVETLSNMSEHEPVAEVIQTMRSKMENQAQTPWLRPEGSRRRLFGSGEASDDDARFIVGADDLIDGGLAMGLEVGTELVARDPTVTTRVQVTEVGLTHARVRPLEGEVARGLTLKVAPDSPYRYEAFVPREGPNEAELIVASRSISVLARSRVTIVSEPFQKATTHVIWFDAGHWWLRARADSSPIRLGTRFDARAILKALRASAVEPHVYIAWPAPAELAAMLPSPPRAAPTLAEAKFTLAARIDPANKRSPIEVAWLPTSAIDDRSVAIGTSPIWMDSRASTAPRRLDPTVPRRLIEQIEVLRLARIWNRAERLSETAAFGYRLAFRRSDKSLPEGWHVPVEMTPGQQWELALITEDETKVDRRFAYVFSLSEGGTWCYLYPHTSGENAFPRLNEASPLYSLPVSEEGILHVENDCTSWTYLLVSSDTPLRIEHVFPATAVLSDGRPALDCIPPHGHGSKGTSSSSEVHPKPTIEHPHIIGRWGIERVEIPVTGCDAP